MTPLFSTVSALLSHDKHRNKSLPHTISHVAKCIYVHTYVYMSPLVPTLASLLSHDTHRNESHPYTMSHVTKNIYI